MQRWITAGILVPFGAFLVFSPLLNGMLFIIVYLCFCLMMCLEISQLVEKQKIRFHLWPVSIAVTLSFVNHTLYGMGIYGSTDLSVFYLIGLMIFCTLFLIIMFLESISGSFEKSFETMGFTLFAYIFVGIMAPFMVLLKLRDLSGWLLSYGLFIPWLADAGGLIFGKFFGKHTLPFLSSPKKTIEGYVGTVVFGMITAVLLYFAQNTFPIPTTFSLPQMLIIGGLLVVAGAIGDLAESTIKRWAGVKDSSNFLPGHGGFFDRMDSVVTTAPVLYILSKLMGY